MDDAAGLSGLARATAGRPLEKIDGVVLALPANQVEDRGERLDRLLSNGLGEPISDARLGQHVDDRSDYGLSLTGCLIDLEPAAALGLGRHLGDGHFALRGRGWYP